MQKSSDQELEQSREEARKAALEILTQLYEAILSFPEFTLNNGAKGRFESFYAPETDADGNTRCGIDVRLQDGSLLEFTIGHTGWGNFLPAAQPSPRGHGQ